MRTDLRSLTWQAWQLPEALPHFARRLGLAGDSDGTHSAPRGPERAPRRLAEWFSLMAARYGMEVEEVSASFADFERLVQGGAPAVLRLPQEDEYFLLIGSRGSKAQLLDPHGSVRKVPVEAVVQALSAVIDGPHREAVDRILQGAAGDLRRQEKIRRALLRELASTDAAPAGWLVRLQPGAGFWTQLREAGGFRFLWTSILAHAVYYTLWLVSWWLIARGALAGRIQGGWLVAWALLLATLVPLRSLVVRCQGRFSIAAGAVLRRRLLDGALKLVPDEVRHQGVGQLLGRVVESEAVESMALAGGLAVLTAGTEILMACFVLAAGAAPRLQLLALALALSALSLLGFHYYRRRARWTISRLAVTYDLVERLVGHRTVVAQQLPDLRHHEEDRALEGYIHRARAMDWVRVWLAAVPRGWLVLGFLALLPVLIQGGISAPRVAVSLGGLLLIHRALSGLVGGLAQLASAWISWQQVSDIFAAARDRVMPSSGAVVAPETGSQNDTPLLAARSVSYRYPGRSHMAVESCSLEVRPGERLLIEGPSGGGKSTLTSLLAALRAPTSGSLFLGGLDHRSVVGEDWRRKVTMVPQFHENHIVSETFAFNVLMGRRWPPEGMDLRDAELVCRDLGLGDLIDKMPGGMLQRVGEAGWKLSHGERSRLFIARGLIQDPEVLIIDEGFGALDPESLRRAMECVLGRARGLLVIAHP